jgi:hypothetical protein
MYIYYEEFKPHPYALDVQSVYEFVFSSDSRSTRISFYDVKEKTTFDLISKLFKAVPLQNRSYELDTHIWTFLGISGARLIASIESLRIGLPDLKFELKKVSHLRDRINKSQLHLSEEAFLNIEKPPEIKFNERDFFYAPAASASSISGEALYAALSALIGCSSEDLKSATPEQLKKYKRSASLKYHPDRNNGDSLKMSEFNMLWGIFTRV